MSTPEEYNKIRIKKLEKKLEKNHARQIKIKDELGLSEKGSSDAELDLMTQEAQETIGKIEAGTIHTPEATVTPEVSPTPVIMPKSLDETLDEMEVKARASIKENADAIADKALKGNQEEIDASTIRINQHNTLKENIDELQKIRDTVTTSNDQSFGDTLVPQIDNKISELKNLNPYKSPEVETSEKEARENENVETQEDVEPETAEDENTEIQEQTDEEGGEQEETEIPFENHITNPKADTVNELYKSDENSLNSTFNPREKTIGEAYQEGGIEKKPEIVFDGKYELLVEKRTKYIEAKNSELGSHRETQEKLNSIRKFFALFSTRKKFTESYETQKLHNEYLNERVAYGKNLREAKKSELSEKVSSSQITQEEALRILDQYTEGELFEKIIIEEQETIQSLELKKSPTKIKMIVEKAMGGIGQLKEAYKQSTPEAIQKILGNRYSRTVALGLFWSVISFASIPSAVGRIAGSLIGGTGAVAVGKGIDKIGDSLINTESALREKATKNQFETEMVLGLDGSSLQKVIARYEKNRKFESNARKIKTITKLLAQTGTAIALGRGASTAISDFVNSDQFITPKDTIFDAVKKADLIKNAVTQNALHEIKTGINGAIKNVGEIGSKLPDNANEVKESLKEFFENTKESGGEILDKAKDKIDEIRESLGGSDSAQDTTSAQTEELEIEQGKVTTPAEETPSTPPTEPKIEPSQPEIPKEEISPVPRTPTFETSAVSVEADNLGAIETFKDLKEKLALSYPDSKLAPENVREILEGDPTKLAIKYGFYNPSQSAESALMQKGEEIGIDTKGNLYFKDTNGTVDYLSQEKGFGGKMADLDSAPKASTTPDQNIRSINPNDEIENSPNTLPKSINPSDGIENQQNSLPKSVDPNDAIAPQKTIPDTIKSINPNDEIGFRKNTFYTQDPEIDAMTPRNSLSSSVPATPETPTTRELLNALDAKGIHTLAEKEFTKDIDSVFQKPNFLMGGSTPGTQTEEWARTLRFIEEKKVTGNHIFEALDSNALQNTEQGEFFTLGEYVRSLKNTTGLLPNDGELLKDYILRAQEYKIEHKINSEDMLKIIDDAEKQGRLNIDEPTRNKIRVRRNAIDTDDVYN